MGLVPDESKMATVRITQSKEIDGRSRAEIVLNGPGPVPTSIDNRQ